MNTFDSGGRFVLALGGGVAAVATARWLATAEPHTRH